MTIPLKETFDTGKPLAPQIDAEFLKTIANALNSLNVAGGHIDKTYGSWTITPGSGTLPGAFIGVKVAGKTFTKASIEGTESIYVKVFMDGVTYPSYTTEAVWSGDWPSHYVVIRTTDVSGYYILPRG